MNRWRAKVSFSIAFLLLLMTAGVGSAEPGDMVEEFGTYVPGITVTAFPNDPYENWDEIEGLVRDPDSGANTALGVSTLQGHTADRFAFARYLPDGSLDPTFGDDGLVLFEHDESVRSFPWDLSLQSDGKIVAVGYRGEDHTPTCDVNGCYKFEIVRLTGAGELDPTFGDGGFVRISLGSQAQYAAGQRGAFAHAVAVQPDGKIVVAGSDHAYGFTRSMVVRLLPNGTLDPSFGTDGIVTATFDPREPEVSESVGDVLIDGQGGIVLAVDPSLWDPEPGGIVRLLPDGSLDESFQGGYIPLPFGFGRTRVALQSSGRLIAASDKGLMRFRKNGVVDTSFGKEGRRNIPGHITAIDIGDGDLIHLAGQNGRVLQVTPNGDIDYNFDPCGFHRIEVPRPAGTDLPAEWSGPQAIVSAGSDLIVGGGIDAAYPFEYDEGDFILAKVEGGSGEQPAPEFRPDLWMSFPTSAGRKELSLDPNPKTVGVSIWGGGYFSLSVDNLGHPTDQFTVKMTKGPGNFDVTKHGGKKGVKIPPCSTRAVASIEADASGSVGDTMQLEFTATSVSDPTKSDVFRVELVAV